MFNRVRPFINKEQVTFWMLGLLILSASLVHLDKSLGWHERTHTQNISAAKVSSFADEVKLREKRFQEVLVTKKDLGLQIAAGSLILLALGLLLDFLWLIGRNKKEGFWVRRSSVSEFPEWGFNHLLKVFVILFFSELLIGALEWIFLPRSFIQKEDGNFLLMTNTLIRDLIAAAFIIILLRYRLKGHLSSIGLTFKHFLSNMLLGALGYVALLPLLLVALVATLLFAGLLSYEPPIQPVVRILMTESDVRQLLYFSSFVAVVGPMLEEVLFRGFSYPLFKKKWGVVTGMMVSGALFSLMHASWVAFLPIWVLGIFLAYLFEWTGSLVPSITAHTLHNLLMVGLTLFFRSLSAAG